MLKNDFCFYVEVEGRLIAFYKFYKVAIVESAYGTQEDTLISLKGFDVTNGDDNPKRVYHQKWWRGNDGWNVKQNDYPDSIIVERQERLMNLAETISYSDGQVRYL